VRSKSFLKVKFNTQKIISNSYLAEKNFKSGDKNPASEVTSSAVLAHGDVTFGPNLVF
jgi:hypothetical protein